MTDQTNVTFRILEDELLAIRCQLGEHEAFDALVDRWHIPLWRYCRRLVGTDDGAAEATQDVWLRVLRGIGRLRDPAKLRSWLFGIAHRVLMDRLRVKYAAADFVDIDDVDLAAAGLEGDEAELEAAQDALDRLPLIEREVLTLFYLRELSVAEVADSLQIPVGTAKSRLHRARRLLRRALDTADSKGAR